MARAGLPRAADEDSGGGCGVTLTVGSLFSGIGGFDAAFEAVEAQREAQGEY